MYIQLKVKAKQNVPVKIVPSSQICAAAPDALRAEIACAHIEKEEKRPIPVAGEKKKKKTLQSAVTALLGSASLLLMIRKATC